MKIVGISPGLEECFAGCKLDLPDSLHHLLPERVVELLTINEFFSGLWLAVLQNACDAQKPIRISLLMRQENNPPEVLRWLCSAEELRSLPNDLAQYFAEGARSCVKIVEGEVLGANRRLLEKKQQERRVAEQVAWLAVAQSEHCNLLPLLEADHDPSSPTDDTCVCFRVGGWDESQRLLVFRDGSVSETVLA